MRASTRLGGLVFASVASLAVLGWLWAQVGLTAPAPAKAPDKGFLDDREELANKLLERVTLKDPLENVALKQAVDFLGDKFGLTVIVDRSLGGGDPAAVALNGNEDVLNQPISLRVMKNVRLGTVLQAIVDQVNGVYLIYPDHIKIVSAARAFTLTKPVLRTYSGVDPDPQDAQMEPADALVRAIPLVTTSFRERPLTEALRDIEVRTNATIVLSNQAANEAKTQITARFTNVPVESAVATIAEMAGLKLAHKGNVLLVTTADRAAEFDPPPAKPVMPAFGGAALGLNPGVDELTKKVAELEKAVGELKAKKPGS
jgi:hypothetical protein